MALRKIFLTVFILGSWSLLSCNKNAAPLYGAAKYFESIRGNDALLTQFFQAMPKGGDLHHHFSGAIYAEEMYDIALKGDFFVSRDSLFIYREMPPSKITRDKSIFRLSDARLGSDIRSRLLRFWSVKDFVPGNESAESHFFQSFGRFGPVIDGSESLFLQALKERAIKENVQYIETMFIRPSFDRDAAPFKIIQKTYDSLLLISGTLA